MNGIVSGHVGSQQAKADDYKSTWSTQMESQGPTVKKAISCGRQTVPGCRLGAKRLGDRSHSSFPHELQHGGWVP